MKITIKAYVRYVHLNHENIIIKTFEICITFMKINLTRQGICIMYVISMAQCHKSNANIECQMEASDTYVLHVLQWPFMVLM